MIKELLKRFFNTLGYVLLKKQTYKSLISLPYFSFLWNKLAESERKFIAPYLIDSKSQYAQDLFVLSEMKKKNLPKYFVEFGATNGIDFSNTYLLEKHLNWEGIVVEPARVWHHQLYENRSCQIDKRCVYSTTGKQIEFCETQNPNKNFNVSGAELSTIKKYLNSGDWASGIRKNNSIIYMVETVSLNDLLSQHSAPKHIGYMSIDTEGSELEILEKFDFVKYRVEIISVEHNSNLVIRKSLNELMTKNGYIIKFENLFGADDIYVLNN